jgi:hypothetical protein
MDTQDLRIQLRTVGGQAASLARIFRGVLKPTATMASGLVLPWAAAAALCGTGPSAAGRAELRVSLETRAGGIVEGRVRAIEDGVLIVDAEDGARRIPLAELLLLSVGAGTPPGEASSVKGPPAAAVASAPETAESPTGAPDLLFLSHDGPGTGDRLVGRLLGGDEFGVRFALDAKTEVTVPFERIERLLPRADLPIDRLALLEGGGKDDRVWQRRADGGFDSLSGVVERVGKDKLVFDGALGALSFSLDEIAAVVLAPGGEPGQPLPGRPVVARLVGGSRLAGGLLELDREHVVLATRFADRLQLPLSALVGMVMRDTRVLLLADLVPVDVQERPTLGRPEDFLFPWRADLSVTGRLLSVGGVPRATGLGVHANSTLVYELPSGASRLRVTAGLVDEVVELPATGSVSFEILVDGESRASSGVLHEGQTPVVLRVDELAGHRRLELRVGDGGDDDAGDRAAWVDGVILLGDD